MVIYFPVGFEPRLVLKEKIVLYLGGIHMAPTGAFCNTGRIAPGQPTIGAGKTTLLWIRM